MTLYCMVYFVALNLSFLYLLNSSEKKKWVNMDEFLSIVLEEYVYLEGI